MTALLILPLVGAVAISVDLGAWYARAAQIQRVADAAALAGAVYLPDTERSAEVAMDTIRSNGIPVQGSGFTGTTPDNQISVTITPILGGTSRLQVDIVETSADQYFSTVFTEEVSVGRQATAEFIKPVAMGSPKNYLGTGSLTWSDGAPAQRVWLAISGQCASREQGERIMTASDGNFNTTNPPPRITGAVPWAGCEPGTGGTVEENPEFDERGYYYAIEVPPSYSGALSIDLYDGPYCTSGTTGTGDSNSSRFTTRYRLLDRGLFDPRQADATDVLYEEEIAPSSSRPPCARWDELFRWTPQPGIYYLQVQALPPASLSTATMEGSNNFGLRARPQGSLGTFSSCDSRTAPATCPRVYGTEHMGVVANLGSDSGDEASFFLAEIGPEHSGKTLEITLWDMGEGTQELRILNPTGSRANFSWQVLCLDGDEPPCAPSETAPRGGWSGSGTALDTSTPNYDSWPYTRYEQPRSNRYSGWRYNDRLIQIEVQLPDDIDEAYGGQTWWMVEYLTDTAPTDRTTWSVIVRGDPVRLVP